MAIEEGVTSGTTPVYLNTTLEITSVENIYQGNLAELGEVKRRYDPTNLMSSTTKFTIPFVIAPQN